MLGLNQDDYRKAVAQSLINHNGSIADINKTLNNTLNPNGSSGVLETLDTHADQIATQTGRINGIGNNGFTPGACTDGANHWVFVVGTDNQCWSLTYSDAANSWGSWLGGTWHSGIVWTGQGGLFSSGLCAYYANAQIHVYGRSTSGGDLYYRYATLGSGATASKISWGNNWTDLGGNIGGLGQ